ncbi:MAG TPA: S-adenosylmethionine decarboxylase [Anaerolineae bacterium]|jgi:S-adenosylmethionine/arginine decarboxylase-like enzyme
MPHNVNAHVFGWELILDLHQCDPEKIRSRDAIIRFVIELCDRIEMKRYGDPFVERFGLDKAETMGYSLVQLIETSSVTAHFAELTNSVYLNVFSCKAYDPKKVKAFAQEYFCSKQATERFVERV